MPAPLIKEGWAEALEPGIREWFFNGYNRRPSMISTFFNVMPSSKDSEYFHSFGAISPNAWDDFKNSGAVASVGFDAGYKTTFTHNEFIVELPIRKTLIEDNLYSQILDPSAQLGDSAALKREQDAANVFNNATSSSYVGGDNVALGSNSHPNGPTTSGTQDNLYAATALSAANVETVRQAMMDFTDDKGNLAGVYPNLLIVPPELENTAKIITQTQAAVGNANNDINPQMGRFSYAVWHYLTSSTTWFMADSVKMKQSLIWFDRIPVDIYPKVADQTVYITYIARMRYSIGWRDWRWVAVCTA